MAPFPADTEEYCKYVSLVKFHVTYYSRKSLDYTEVGDRWALIGLRVVGMCELSGSFQDHGSTASESLPNLPFIEGVESWQEEGARLWSLWRTGEP